MEKNLQKVRIQLLDESEGSVVSDVDVYTTADAVTCTDGKTIQDKIDNGELSGGTEDYLDLTNKPTINEVELTGNKTLDDLGIQAKGDYLPKVNPTLPASSQLKGTKVDGSTIPLISLWQMLGEQEFIMLGTSSMPIGFVVTDDETRPIVVRTGTINDYVAFQSDIPEVINNLSSTDINKSLSANQGRILNSNINNINTTLTNNLKRKADKYGLILAEVDTGLTLFGKPIYSKTFTKTSGIEGENTFDIVIPGVDDIWIDPSNSFIKTNSHSFGIPKTTIQKDAGVSFSSLAANTVEAYLTTDSPTHYTLTVSCGTNVVGDSISKIIVTVKYTKTTD